MSWSRVYSRAAANFTFNSLDVLDGKLWALSNEDNPTSGIPWSGRIFYSSDGDNWTEDTAWLGPCSVGGAYTGGQIFVHQNVLYLICNYDAGGPNEAGRLYRRQNNTWVLVHSQALGSKLRYHKACSNDAWIVIGGAEMDACGDLSEAVIWVWNGSSMVEEFRGDCSSYPYDSDAYISLYYNGDWLISVERWLDESTQQWVLRYRGDGSWPIFHVGTRAAGGYVVGLKENHHGLFWGGELRDTGGQWSDTGFLGTAGPNHHYGSMWGGRIDGGDEGRTYIYTPEGWYYKLLVDLGVTEFAAFENFGGQLYACGGRALIGPAIWRRDIYHQTGSGWWPDPTARVLVCDHEYGDTLYVGVYDEYDEPLVLKIGTDLDWWEYLVRGPHRGSLIGVQTANRRDTVYAFGYFGEDDQIQLSDKGGWGYGDSVWWGDADEDWGTDKVPTLEYHPTSGSDLVITSYGGQDLMQTLTGNKPWSKLSDIPILPRCQMRVQDDVWIGSDMAVASPVRMYSGGSWADKSNGLPAIAINDLELGF